MQFVHGSESKGNSLVKKSIRNKLKYNSHLPKGSLQTSNKGGISSAGHRPFFILEALWVHSCGNSQPVPAINNIYRHYHIDILFVFKGYKRI